MHAKLSFTRTATLGAIAIVLILLSTWLEARDWSVQTAQVSSGRDLGIPAQPEEKVRLEGLRFSNDGASLRRNSRAILDAAAEILKGEPGKTVYVDAYCDRTRSRKANLRLAQQRAESVKAYLEAQGIPSECMIAHGFGAGELGRQQ
jgi:outer membrane protein OmpA-like peptidoglycan-associated protein